MQDIRAYAIHNGVVTDNADPRNLGRIKAKIPGYINETGWALPYGSSGGIKNLGTFFIPPIGADVMISFADGLVDQPFYSGGSWGLDGAKSGVPAAARDALEENNAEAHLIHVTETPMFEVVADSRNNKTRFYIRSKYDSEQKLDGTTLMIELDETNGTIALSAPTAISIRSHGAINIEAAQVTINGRVVASSDKAI